MHQFAILTSQSANQPTKDDDVNSQHIVVIRRLICRPRDCEEGYRNTKLESKGTHNAIMLIFRVLSYYEIVQSLSAPGMQTRYSMTIVPFHRYRKPDCIADPRIGKHVENERENNEDGRDNAIQCIQRIVLCDWIPCIRIGHFPNATRRECRRSIRFHSNNKSLRKRLSEQHQHHQLDETDESI